jgi:hypothetical protein
MGQRMTVSPTAALTPRPEPGLEVGATAGELLDLASGDDFHRWESQVAATGNCLHPVRLEGRITATDRATGRTAVVYDTDTEPGGILRIACGNRREDICPPCSQVYKLDARQIIRSGLTGGKGIPDTVIAHPCVFATLTGPGFGPVHTTRTSPAGRLLPCRPRRDAHQRRCPHGRDISCPRIHRDDDPQLGQALCRDCYDYTGHILFNALAPELWRRFTIYLPRALAALAGITQKQLRQEVSVRFVKVAEYQARGVIHYHAVIRLDGPGNDYRPPGARYSTALLALAVRQAAATVALDTTGYLTRAILRNLAPALRDAAPVPVIDAGVRRILRFGTQVDPRPVQGTSGISATGTALSPQAVANYIAKYATKATGAPGLPTRPVRDLAAIHRLPCSAHHKRLITICWHLAKDPSLAALGLNRSTHTLGYRGQFLTKSRRYSVTFTQLRRARIDYRRQQRHPSGEHDPWGRRLDDRIVVLDATWRYAGTGHGSTAEAQLALAAAARARERQQIAREETWMT